MTDQPTRDLIAEIDAQIARRKEWNGCYPGNVNMESLIKDGYDCLQRARDRLAEQEQRIQTLIHDGMEWDSKCSKRIAILESALRELLADIGTEIARLRAAPMSEEVRDIICCLREDGFDDAIILIESLARRNAELEQQIDLRHKEIGELEATCIVAQESARQNAEDAERYRWVREHFKFANDSMCEIWFDSAVDGASDGQDELDAAIDAAQGNSAGGEKEHG